MNDVSPKQSLKSFIPSSINMGPTPQYQGLFGPMSAWSCTHTLEPCVLSFGISSRMNMALPQAIDTQARPMMTQASQITITPPVVQ